MYRKNIDSPFNTNIPEHDYQVIREFLAQSCGIVLGENKQYLVQNRLNTLLKKFEFSSFSQLIDFLRSDKINAQKVKTAVIDAMTTNETFWFRDTMQFNALTEVVFPELIKQKTGTIKVWSAACSSGQEPYTISMCGEEALSKASKGRNIQIIGTDISETVLSEAKKAVYSENAISRGLDRPIKEKYFLKTHEGFKLSSVITEKVRFQQFNLLKPFSVLGHFDVIFCRNVLIYFSEDVKRDILARMAGVLEPGGYLFLSSTESMPMGMEGFETVKGGVRYYRKIK